MPAPQPEKIKTMFSQVAEQYDRANNILSLGIHHLWRKRLVKMAELKPGCRILDCATGTGDLALAFKLASPKSQVVGTDFCVEMLEPAKQKADLLNLDVRFQHADVTQLPFLSNTYDVCSISFGIRNVENPVLGLTEMTRVTKDGGKLLILEFGQTKIPGFSGLYKFYSEKIIPILGGLVTGQKYAYEYLQVSSQNFPSGDKFLDLMSRVNGLTDLKYVSLSGGIAYIYSATVKKGN